MTDPTTVFMIAGFIVAVAAVTGFTFYIRKKRSEHLRIRFGPEYDRTIAAEGNPRKAEDLLARREKRVEKLAIHPVPPDMRERFARAWKQVQARFVDEPGTAVAEADALVQKVMESRGYPMGSFEERANDISVDHPVVVEEYRAAHRIAVQRERGMTSTESLRQAFMHYRALFRELLELNAPELAAASA